MPRKLDILFVEDEPDIRKVVEISLSLDPGLATQIFISGEDALAFIRRTGRTFDLGLFNLRLPAMTGIDLHRMIRQLPGCEKLKTVLITASIRNHEIQSYREVGIAGVIGKPFDPLMLASKIRRLADTIT